jgi:hypothetical protein
MGKAHTKGRKRDSVCHFEAVGEKSLEPTLKSDLTGEKSTGLYEQIAFSPITSWVIQGFQGFLPCGSK